MKNNNVAWRLQRGDTLGTVTGVWMQIEPVWTLLYGVLEAQKGRLSEELEYF